MILFYGLDNFLLNQSVNMYLKIHQLNPELNQDIHENEFVTSYYLESEFLEITVEKILNDVSSLDLFNNKKIIIINDYYLVLNSNPKVLKQFIAKIKQFENGNVVILKMLTKKINSQIFNAKIETIFINSYNKDQLKKWVLEKIHQYQLKFTPDALDALVAMFPNSLNIIDNELKMMCNLNQVIDIKKIREVSNKYFSYNPYKLINYWLNKDYVSFWMQYRSYWEKIKYEKVNLFLIVSYQLELIRNIKLLLNKNFSTQEIADKLNISLFQAKNLLNFQLEIKEINSLLVKAHELDFKVKSGKIAKNLAIDLFFCEI